MSFLCPHCGRVVHDDMTFTDGCPLNPPCITSPQAAHVPAWPLPPEDPEDPEDDGDEELPPVVPNAPEKTST